jgi:hypothetical protein
VNADAGSIYIRDKEELRFTYTQNATLQRRLPLGEKLIYNIFTIPADESSIAGYSAITGQELNIPDVYTLESIVPYRFDKRFDETAGYDTHSVLAVPLKTVREDVIGVLQVINAQNEEGNILPFSDEDAKMMVHFASMATMALERAQMTRTLILRMIRMAELRDPKETGAHVNRVGSYSVEIYERWAKENNIPAKEIQNKRDVLRMAAMLHDVGKVAISDQILKKPTRLTEEEFDIMKQHTFFGARLFIDKKSDFDEAAAAVALSHHEWWNGNGYPGHVDLAATGPGLSFSVQKLQPRGRKGYRQNHGTKCGATVRSRAHRGLLFLPGCDAIYSTTLSRQGRVVIFSRSHPHSLLWSLPAAVLADAIKADFDSCDQPWKGGSGRRHSISPHSTQ